MDSRSSSRNFNPALEVLREQLFRRQDTSRRRPRLGTDVLQRRRECSELKNRRSTSCRGFDRRGRFRSFNPALELRRDQLFRREDTCPTGATTSSRWCGTAIFKCHPSQTIGRSFLDRSSSDHRSMDSRSSNASPEVLYDLREATA